MIAGSGVGRIVVALTVTAVFAGAIADVRLTVPP